MSIEVYSKRLDGVGDELLDPAVLEQWHDEGSEVLSRFFSGALSSADPIPLLVSTLLMKLRVASLQEVLAAGVTTVSVSAGVIYVNGVAMASPRGLIRGEQKLVDAIALHGALHHMLLHNIRVAELFRELKDQGVIGGSGSVDVITAWKIANLVMDAVDDSIVAEASAELAEHSHVLLEQHKQGCRKLLANLISSYCNDSINSDWLNHNISGQTVPVIEVLRTIICALPQDNTKHSGRGPAYEMEQALEDVQLHFQPLEDDSETGIQTAKLKQAAIVSSAGLSVARGSVLSRLCGDAQEYWL